MMLALRSLILLSIVFGVAGCAERSKTSETDTTLNQKFTVKNSTPFTKHRKTNQQYIVHIESDMDNDAIERYLKRYSLTVVSKITTKKYVVEIDPAVGIERISERIKSSKYIRYIQVNAQYRL